MTPEEKYNRDIWYVLQKIKERSLRRLKNQAIEYRIDIKPAHLVTDEPQPPDEAKIIEQLIENGIVKKIKPETKIEATIGDYSLNPFYFYYLDIIQPKFNNFYKKWEEISENPWLSEESKIVQKEKLFEKQRKEAEIRVKEIRKHFEELNERQKELKESEERIYSRIRKELDVPIQYFKSHEEIIKKISEQLAPLKDALERVGRTQQIVKISLTPALQRLAPSLKQLEEQIKNFNELYKTTDRLPSEAIISPDIIRIKQGIEMVSELKEIRKQIEKFPPKKGIKIEGLKEGLEKIAKTEKQEDKKASLYKLPTNTKWNDIEIKFGNKFDVEIYVKGKFYNKTNYENLRFYKSGTKDKHPDIHWHFLIILSVCQESNKTQATIENMASSLGKYLSKKVSKEACEQIKSKLSKKIQEVFGINDEPFYPYKKYGFYQPKFKLKPLPTLRGKGEPFITKTPYDDNKKYPEID